MRRLSSASRHRRPRHFDALLRRVQTGPGAAHLQPDRRIGALLVGFGAPHQVPGLGDARLVGRAVEQVPAQRDGGQPVGAAAVDEALPVGFEGAAQAHLRQQRAARAVGLGPRQVRGQARLPRLGARLAAASFSSPASARSGRSSGVSGVVSVVRRVERQAQRVVERRARHIEVRRRAGCAAPSPRPGAPGWRARPHRWTCRRRAPLRRASGRPRRSAPPVSAVFRFSAASTAP